MELAKDFAKVRANVTKPKPINLEKFKKDKE